MKKVIFPLLLLFFAAVSINAQTAAIDKEAPDFTLTDSHGKTHSLSDYKGKYVVLEWINFECPFVKKHYESGNMQQIQRKYTQEDVVWLTICSSAEGKQGYYENDEINKRSEKAGANYTAYLIDKDGKVGKMYSAKTTPHMYVINPEGVLIYAGGIDDKATTDKDDLVDAKNYVINALDASMAGEEVKDKVSQPYGCSVKY